VGGDLVGLYGNRASPHVAECGAPTSSHPCTRCYASAEAEVPTLWGWGIVLGGRSFSSVNLLNLLQPSTLTLIVREPSCRKVDVCPAAFVVHSCSNNIFFLSASSLLLESMPVLVPGKDWCQRFVCWKDATFSVFKFLFGETGRVLGLGFESRVMIAGVGDTICIQGSSSSSSSLYLFWQWVQNPSCIELQECMLLHQFWAELDDVTHFLCVISPPLIPF